MPTTKQPATRLTAKQRACPHPPAHVHATYDDRWETCDLCHIIRARPLPAPWIVEWDESQPPSEPPALFATPTEPAETIRVPVPTKRPRVTLHEPGRGEQPATEETEETANGEPRTFRELWRAAHRDRDVMGSWRPFIRSWISPSLDEMYTPDQIATCHRCHGLGTVEDQRITGAVNGHCRNWEGHLQPTYAIEAAPVASQPRTCPRCEGAGRIPKYILKSQAEAQAPCVWCGRMTRDPQRVCQPCRDYDNELPA